MKKRISAWTTLAALLLIAIFAGCDQSAEYDIRGTWDYVQYHMETVVYDNGTISFSGDPSGGTWTLYNLYDVEYIGTYHVNNTKVVLEGEEQWIGNFMDETHMEGSWQGEDDSGTWTATKLETEIRSLY